jgi:hypothetical protein
VKGEDFNKMESGQKLARIEVDAVLKSKHFDCSKKGMYSK